MSDEITNTSARHREHMEAIRERRVSANQVVPVDGILAMERSGQTELVLSDLLPTGLGFDESDADYEALGFVFGDVVDGDPLFRKAKLPDGWTREGSDHAMWSYLLDADGYRRVAIFYKAAFYDRRAEMSIEAQPRTAAQTDAYEVVEQAIGGLPRSKDDYAQPFWRSDRGRRFDADYVYAFRGCIGEIAAERDGHRYPHGGANGYADDGRRVEVTVAPDGTITDTHEFTVEPTSET